MGSRSRSSTPEGKTSHSNSKSKSKGSKGGSKGNRGSKSGRRSVSPANSVGSKGRGSSRERMNSPASFDGSTIVTVASPTSQDGGDDLGGLITDFTESFSLDGERKPQTPKAETPEEREARIEAEKEERRLAFIRENYTFLNFIMLDGSRRSLQLDRITTYMEVQTEIARVNPKGKKMFIVVHPETKERISSDNFKEGPEFNIVETFLAKIPKFYPRLKTKWDFLQYHGAPADWVDPVIARRLAEEARIKREAEEKRKEEEADEIEKKHKAERMAAEQQANEEWADLLGDI